MRQGAIGRNCLGQAMMEFALTIPFVCLLTIGGFALGMTIDRHLVQSQLVRHAGNMYARGVDFSSQQNKQLLVDAATGLQMTTTGGLGTIYLSLVIPAVAGNNQGLPVVAQRFVIGNLALASSGVAMPTTVLANGDVQDYENDLAARAALPPGLTLTPGDRIYVAEAFHAPGEFRFPGFFTPKVLYARALF
jgi:hypothetical protein